MLTAIENLERGVQPGRAAPHHQGVHRHHGQAQSVQIEMSRFHDRCSLENRDRSGTTHAFARFRVRGNPNYNAGAAPKPTGWASPPPSTPIDHGIAFLRTKKPLRGLAQECGAFAKTQKRKAPILR